MPKPAKAETVKAVIYARYSSHSQTEQSIEGQLHDAYEYAKRENIAVIGEYIDRALTGTKDARPDFQRMIADAQKKQFTLVIVWKLDRFARNRYDSAIYKAKLKKCGVKVVSVKENITDSPEGIILEGLLESMAEYYSANLSQNVKRGLRESQEKGYYCGGSIPYGYRVADHKLVADEKTAPVIRYIFEQYASGVPKKQIIAELDRRGVKNSRGKPLSLTAFQHALRQTTYIGEYVYNGKVVPGCAEPLVTRDVFDKVQALLNRRAHAPAAAKARVPYLLTGKVYCGLCGSPMFGESGKSHTGAYYTYYCCYNRKRKKSCDKKNERRDSLETFVVARTMEYILSPSNINAIASAVVKEYNKEFDDFRVRELEKALEKLDREYESLIDAVIDLPKSARPKIASRMEQLDYQRSELEIDISKLRVASRLRLTEEEVKAWLHTFNSSDPEDDDFRQRLIDTMINSVYVYEDRIIIFYNIRGGKQVTHKDILDTIENAPSPEDSTDREDNKESEPSSGSDLELNGGLSHFKSEPFYVFVNGIFGCVFPHYET